MSRIFITGSTDGLGFMAAELLLSQGHEVVLHARTPRRAEDVRRRLSGAAAVVVGDLSRLAEMKSVAEQINRLGMFDAVVHNVGVGYREPKRIETEDGLPHVFAINVMAPYVLTALIGRPRRLVYLSSGMHHGVAANLDDIRWKQRRWSGSEAYAESKLHDVLLAFAIARRWPDVMSNALEPGWVPTRMGGPSAPDDLDQAHLTQVWLATSDDPGALVSSEYFYHLQRRAPNPATRDHSTQDRLIELCESFSGIRLPD